jgi:hypothetical protein
MLQGEAEGGSEELHAPELVVRESTIAAVR